jgi:mannitol-1-/sugar-/sorbitol-6-phosphatase
MSHAIPCQALLFDADGVLVDSDESVGVSWTRWAERWDLDPVAVLAMVHGRRSVDTVTLLIDPTRRTQALADIDRFEIEDAAAVPACPGATELLISLPLDAWAVVTSGTRALATARLAAAGLPAPQVLVTADDVPRGKPDPAGYLRAAQALGRPPHESVVLEDSPAGVAAGTAAGATVVGVTPRALDSEAAIVVRDLSNLSWTDATLHIPATVIVRSNSRNPGQRVINGGVPNVGT